MDNKFYSASLSMLIIATMATALSQVVDYDEMNNKVRTS